MSQSKQAVDRAWGKASGPAAWALLAALLGVALAFVPLFDLVGYELALAISPLVAAAGIQLGLREVRRARVRLPRSVRERADVRPLRAVLTLHARACVRVLPALLAPLAILSLNALRVRNCNPTIGVYWYLVLPCCGAIFGAAIGVALGIALPRATAPLASLGATLMILLVAAVGSLARLYFAPPIFVFDPLFGYFAGSLYDEHVAVPTALLCARAYHAAIAVAVLCCAAVALDGHAIAARRSALGDRRRLGLVAAIAVLASIGLYRLGPTLGYRHDAASIAAALGGERRTEHFILSYRPDGPYAHELDDVARELELDYAELWERLGVAPTRPVHAYLFSSGAEKQQLMGAGHTYIAKPWRDEIYINHEPFPQNVMEHELAHVFGAQVGDPLLGVARQGLHLDVGLIEGFAETLSWQSAPLTHDETARVLDVLGRLPALDDVMSPRFWSLPAQQAYAIAGSFCDFLVARAGMAKLAALYRRGGARDAYAQIYGASFSQLAAAWLAHIRDVQLEPAVLERERDRLLRPSIFRRPCARELARRIELAHALSGRGDHAGARALYEEVCADEPDDPGHLDELLAETLKAEQRVEAETLARRLIAHKKTSGSQRGAAWATLGDLRAQAGDLRGAVDDYALAEALPADDALARLYSVKRVLAQRALDGKPPLAPTQQALLALTHAASDAGDDFARLTTAAAAAPHDGLLVYLGARQLANKGLHAEADEALGRALAAGLPDPRFEREAQRLRAEMAFRQRLYTLAATRYAALLENGSAAARLDADRWTRRARYFAQHAP